MNKKNYQTSQNSHLFHFCCFNVANYWTVKFKKVWHDIDNQVIVMFSKQWPKGWGPSLTLLSLLTQMQIQSVRSQAGKLNCVMSYSIIKQTTSNTYKKMSAHVWLKTVLMREFRLLNTAWDKTPQRGAKLNVIVRVQTEPEKSNHKKKC